MTLIARSFTTSFSLLQATADIVCCQRVSVTMAVECVVLAGLEAHLASTGTQNSINRTVKICKGPVKETHPLFYSCLLK